jgi:uncharacterized protein (TIGR02594 family)
MAGIFQPTLQTQVQPEMAVEDRSTASAIGAITDITSSFFKSQQASRPSGPTYNQAKLEQFSTELSNLQQLSESGDVAPSRLQADLRLAAQRVASLDVPEALKQQFENISGTPFDAFSYDDPEEFNKNQLLQSDFAKGIRPSVISSLEAEGIAATPEAVDAAVFAKIEEKNLLDNQVEIQRQNRALGKPIQTTPVLEGIKSDYQVLLDSVKAAQADSIVEQSEYRNLQTSVSNLIATKYVGFETNPEINGVIQQMNGLLNDIGKGVSSTPSAVLADKLQVALQSKGFGATQIAVARSLLEQNPEQFQNILGQPGESGTVADALVTLLDGGVTTDKPLVDIFDTSLTPQRSVVAGENPSIMEIPKVSENPEAYQQVVDSLSQAGTTTDPNRLLGNTEARNSWINSMNIVGNAVASQSDEFILGEKLLSMFASNGVVKNLEAVYRTDPANAAQTNDVLQGGLAAERIRQVNELNNRLNAGVGEGQLVLASPEGVLQLNNNLIDRNAASLVGGEAGWNEMKGKIAAAGGLEAFLKLPKTTGRGPNLDAAIMVGGTPYFLSDMFRIEFETVAKMSNNIKMIDTKLNNLEVLATTYQSETDLLRGTGTTGESDTFDVSQLSGQTSADLITTAESVLGLDENKQKDVLATFLSAGGVEIDPSQTAWCAAFVNATLTKTGLDGTGALNARSFLDWGTEITSPQLGDVVVLSRGDNPAQGHVGFFKGFDADGNILILGGNQGDSVSVQSFNKDRLLGYRRPDGATGVGTEAGLSQAIYRAANDPNFLPTAAPVEGLTTSLRPQARPEAGLPEEVEVDRTKTEGGSFGGQGLVRVIDSPAYSRELQDLLQALRVDPEQTFGVADLDELEAAQADGRLKAGDKVVVGQGARAFVVELE